MGSCSDDSGAEAASAGRWSPIIRPTRSETAPTARWSAEDPGKWGSEAPTSWPAPRYHLQGAAPQTPPPLGPPVCKQGKCVPTAQPLWQLVFATESEFVCRVPSKETGQLRLQRQRLSSKIFYFFIIWLKHIESISWCTDSPGPCGLSCSAAPGILVP